MQNTPTRARLGTRTRDEGRDDRRENRVTVQTPTWRPTRHVRRDNRRDDRRDARRECDSFENDRVAFRARGRLCDGMFWQWSNGVLEKPARAIGLVCFTLDAPWWQECWNHKLHINSFCQLGNRYFCISWHPLCRSYAGPIMQKKNCGYQLFLKKCTQNSDFFQIRPV